MAEIRKKTEILKVKAPQKVNFEIQLQNQTLGLRPLPKIEK